MKAHPYIPSGYGAALTKPVGGVILPPPPRGYTKVNIISCLECLQYALYFIRLTFIVYAYGIFFNLKVPKFHFRNFRNYISETTGAKIFKQQKYSNSGYVVTRPVTLKVKCNLLISVVFILILSISYCRE